MKADLFSFQTSQDKKAISWQDILKSQGTADKVSGLLLTQDSELQVTDLQSRPVSCQSKCCCNTEHTHPGTVGNPRFWEPVRATAKLTQPHENLTTVGTTQNLSSTYFQWTFTECLWHATGNGNPLQYYCLENPTDRSVWWATIHRVTKSRTQMSKWVMCHKYYSDWWEAKHKQNMGAGFSSVAVMSDSLQLHGLQHARPPCASPTPGAYPNSCPLSWWCHATISSSVVLLPSLFPSIKVFSKESVLHIRWPKYWSFSFSITPSNEYSGLISFRMDWLDLLAVQGTLERLLQHQSSKASIQFSLPVQLSQPHITTGKTTALTRWTFVGKVMSLLFNMLSRLVIAFLPRSKCLLISWLQSPSAVILENTGPCCHFLLQGIFPT